MVLSTSPEQVEKEAEHGRRIFAQTLVEEP